VGSASEFLSVFPSVLQSVFSCSPARNACHSHPSYIYHPLDICPSADCKYSLYAVQNANLTIKFSVFSLTASYSRNSLFLNEPEDSVSYQQEFATSLSRTQCVCLVHALSFCLLKALANIALPCLFHTASFTTYRRNIT